MFNIFTTSFIGAMCTDDTKIQENLILFGSLSLVDINCLANYLSVCEAGGSGKEELKE